MSENEVKTEENDRQVNRGLVDFLDGAFGLVQLPLQVMGLLSREADTVEIEMAAGRRLVRFSDRSDEGWEPFELEVPTEIELWFANASVLKRSALFWCDGPTARLEAELEAIGAHPSPRREMDWVLATDHEGVEASVRTRGSHAVLIVSQRRSHEDLHAAVKAQLERMNRSGDVRSEATGEGEAMGQSDAPDEGDGPHEHEHE